MRARRIWPGLVLVAAGLLPAMGQAGTGKEAAQSIVSTLRFQGQSYALATINPATQDLRLYWAGADGAPSGNFTALQKQVTSGGGKLLFAANAGMFDPAGKPVGLLVQDGKETFPLNLRDGPGNFYLKPNGVFAINQHRHALIVKSEDYASLVPPAVWATQSGPLLIEGGDINPDFLPDSRNRKIRSGVGVTAKHGVIFALSRQPVAFYEFAELFRSKLHCVDALYLDGEISAFWMPGEIEKTGQHHFGPLFGLIADPPHEGVTAPPADP